MVTLRGIRGPLLELAIVFVGVAMAFGVENLREGLNERNVGSQYLMGFRRDLLADQEMLRAYRRDLQAQLENAETVLEFFEGRPNEPQAFFGAYWPTLFALRSTPNRNTMTEVLNSGNLRLVRDEEARSRLLDLHATYARIAESEEHVARDFDAYLYDPSFSTVRFDPAGPWEDNAENQRAVETLLDNIAVENGIRLLIANLQSEGGLMELVESAQSQVDTLLRMIPAADGRGAA